MHSSPDFESWEGNPGKLCVYPDEHDGDNAYLPAHDRTGTYVLGVSLCLSRACLGKMMIIDIYSMAPSGVELHAGPAFYHPTADVYLMLIQVRNDNVWPTSRVKMIKMMVSPRQAQDKHRESSTQKRRPLFHFKCC